MSTEASAHSRHVNCILMECVLGHGVFKGVYVVKNKTKLYILIKMLTRPKKTC